MILDRLFGRMAGGLLVRRAAALGTGAAIGQMAVFLATPIVARIYTKAEFGVLAVFLAASGVAVVVSSLLYEQAIVVADDDEEASAVVKVAGGFVVLSVVFAAVVALAAGDLLADFTNTPALEQVIWMLPPTIAAGGVYQILVSWATRNGSFVALSRSKAALGITLAVSQVALGLLFEGSGGLVAGIFISWIIAILVLLPATRDMRIVHDGTAWAAAMRYRRFPLYSLPASLLNRGALEIPAVGLAALFGPEVAGAFLLANRLVATPTRLITESAYQVYVNEASRLLRDAPEELPTLFARTLRRLTVLAIPPAAIVAAFGPAALTWVFGGEWADAGEYVRLLSLVLVAMLVTQPVAATLWLLERQDLQLIREAARVVLVVLGFLAAWGLSSTPAGAVFAYVLAMTAGYGLLLVLCRKVLADAQPMWARSRLAVT